MLQSSETTLPTQITTSVAGKKRGRPSADWGDRETLILQLLVDGPRHYGYMASVSGWSRMVLRPTLERMRKAGMVKLSGRGVRAMWEAA